MECFIIQSVNGVVLEGNLWPIAALHFEQIKVAIKSDTEKATLGATSTGKNVQTTTGNSGTVGKTDIAIALAKLLLRTAGQL
jgi:hypothetical protein